MEITSFGARLRQLRLRAELTQPELAEGISSVSLISLIEAGKRQPNEAMIEKLALRLKIPADELRGGARESENQSRRLNFIFAEMAFKNGDFATSEAASGKLIESAPALENPEFSYQLHALRGKSLESLGRIEDARQEIELAINFANESGLELEKLELIIDLSRYAKESGDFVTALELIESAQKSVPTQLQQSATYARLLSSAIAIHYLRGDYIRASDLSASALEIFNDQTDPRARASILWNASLAADANQDTRTALIMAQRAASLFAEADDARAEGRLRFTIAWLFTRQTPPDIEAARVQLIRSEKLLQDSGTEIDKAKFDSELSRVEWLAGNYEKALELANNSLIRLDSSEDRLQRAESYLLAARAQISLGREIESSKNLVAARNSLSQMEPSRQNALAWRELGDIYSMLNHLPEAINAYREALHDAGVPASPIAFEILKKSEELLQHGFSQE